jgi:type IV secretory pathway TraG/TraD family ATPase VirD4
VSAGRVLFLAGIAVALLVFLTVERRWLSPAGDSKDGARFARGGELGALRKADGIALGYYRRRLLKAERNASVLLCGPSQSGKTLAAVVRAIREWGDRPLLVLSVKGDVLEHTIGERERRGEVRIFDPTMQTGRQGSGWSPVAASATWSQSRAIAAGLLQIGTPVDRNDREPHWRRSAARYLAPLLLAAHERGETMRTVLSWADTCEQDEPAEALERSQDPAARYALENLQSVWRTDSRYQASVLGTLSTSLDALQEVDVAASTARSDITPEWLCGPGRTLYVVSPASQQRRLQPLFGGMLTALVDGALAIAAQRGRLDPPLLVVLDEVCNAAPLPTLGEYASSAAGQGLVLLSVIQDVAQARDTWGADRAATIIGNHKAKLFWAGTADPTTHEYLRGMLGDQERERESRTSGRSGISTTRARERRPLVAPHHLRTARRGRAVLVYGSLPPAWTDQPLAD